MGFVEPTGFASPETCTYAVRVKREDGTEEVINRLCPYFATCQRQGKGCAGIPPLDDRGIDK